MRNRHRLNRNKKRVLIGYSAYPALYYRRRKDADKKNWYYFNSKINPSFWNGITLKNQTWFGRKSSYYRAKSVVKRNVELLTYSQNFFICTRLLFQSRRYMKRFAIYLIKLMRRKPEIRIRYKHWIRLYLATPWTVRFLYGAKLYRNIHYYTYGWFLDLLRILYAIWCDNVLSPYLLVFIVILCWISYLVYSLLDQLIFSNINDLLHLFI